MVIQNSEVSMTSKTSFASVTQLTIQSELKPAITVDEVNRIGGEDDFLSSLNYARSADGTVKEVDSVNPLVNAAANRQVRYSAMEYLFRLLIMGHYMGENSALGDYLKEKLGLTEEETDVDSLGSYTGMGPQFIMTTTHSYTYWEKSSVEYSSTGTAITADGRKLNFEYSFAMSETFVEKYDTVYSRIANCIDPLVINLDDNPTSISNQTFFFDLDGDGEVDNIHNLGKGSGFLALDKNEDGEINDGMELFGPRTGNGFGELAAFDEDGNGWIDENDSIFEKLRILTINENGEKELYGLKQSDVGAIFLGRINTELKKRDDEGNTTGVLRESGLFLHEKDGHAGGVQHVDFAT